MKVRDLRIEGFGVLSALRLDDLHEGFSVIHGPNGSGKSTLLQFVRGLLLGFDEARRLRLLPPLRGGTPGGSAVIADGVRFTVTRHARNDLSDTLAVNVSHGSPDDVRRMRAAIEGYRPDLVRTLFAVGSLEAHNLGHLVQLAQQDGIDFQSRRTDASWLRSHLETIRHERASLFEAPPLTGRIQELEGQRERLAQQLEVHRQGDRGRHEEHSARLRKLQDRNARLLREIEWLDLELQAVQTDLDACCDRLWSRTWRTLHETRRVEKPEPAIPESLPEIAELDLQIEHCRQVLRDLALSRQELTVESAGLAGSDIPSDPVTFERDRAALRALEGNLHRLDGMVEQVLEAQRIGKCLCDATQAALASSATVMREQVYLLCQSLNRREKESQRRALLTRRDGVDRIEEDLESRIREIQSRRDALLSSQKDPGRARIHHRSRLEAEGCECDEHLPWQHAVQSLPTSAPVVVEVRTDRRVEDNLARPGDGARAEQLADLKVQLWEQLQGVRDRQAAIVAEWAGLQVREPAFATDRSLQELQYEYAVIEQKLADAREQWQSLALLQTTLVQARGQLENETHPPVIADASATFRRLTQGRYSGFRYDPALRELFVVQAGGEQQGFGSLSRGTLDQAGLSLRLAIADEYVRRGSRFPFVFDDVLVDTDEVRLRIAVEVLQEAAARGHQILFLTCQDHLASLFHEMGVTVRGLEREWRPVPRLGSAAAGALPVSALGTLNETKLAEVAVSAFDQVAGGEVAVHTEFLRSQPDTPFWLQPDSPVSLVPSLGAQMGRRLGAIGVSNVAELIDLDPESAEMPLSSLQVSAAQLRTWQAEGRLLCCVPHLTGRDAQLLVACGVLTPIELAEADSQVLLDRTIALRQAASPGSFDWMKQERLSPGAAAIRGWIGNAHRARTLAEALATVGWDAEETEQEGAADDDDFDPGSPDPSSGRGPQTLRRSRRSGAGRANRVALRNSASRMRLKMEATDGKRGITRRDAAEWRYFLHTDSLVVDAPSIGPKMAERLREIGVLTVSDLIGRRPETLATGLADSRITVKTATDWQHQAILMCRVPELRGHDAQILVACGVDSAEQLAGMTPAGLWGVVEPFVNTREAARLLRSASPPDFEEVTDWIRFANHSRALRAA